LQWRLLLSAILLHSDQYHTISILHKQVVHDRLQHADEQAASYTLQPQDNLIWQKQNETVLTLASLILLPKNKTILQGM
jgi:hypothetical protein